MCPNCGGRSAFGNGIVVWCHCSGWIDGKGNENES